MVHTGILTLSNTEPQHYLSIPNRVVAKHIGEGILLRFGLLAHLKKSVERLATTGEFEGVLEGYRQMLQADDVIGDPRKRENEHIESIHTLILENPGVQTKELYTSVVVTDEDVTQNHHPARS